MAYDVVPCVVGGASADERHPWLRRVVPKTAAFLGLAPLRVEEMEPWLRLGIAPQVTRRVGAPPRPAIPRIHPAPLCTVHHATPCIHPATP